MTIRCFVLLLAASASWAQSRETNPYTSPKDVAEGRRLYALFCVFCHGMDGASGRGARLASTFRRHGSSDRDQYRVIADGVSGTEMSGHFLGEEEIWKILAFVRTLERSVTASAAVCEARPGDAAAGRKLFFGKGACLSCHSATIDGRVQGSGRLGPDLSFLGATRARDHLAESLTDPDRAVAGAYRQVRMVTRSGESVTGIRLSEDEYTVHLMIRGEQIRSFLKADLKSLERPAESFMPSYRTVFSAREMDDITSYLCTLKGGPK
ncbi:MAG TPA: c-type cytochrome [Bryobacteraceae bacterium]|jgi:cytochrome c oxidase cbb3-type subunit III|nr:c-type cytochrome [Bryobacteraceae bacterium]